MECSSKVGVSLRHAYDVEGAAPTGSISGIRIKGSQAQTIRLQCVLNPRRWCEVFPYCKPGSTVCVNSEISSYDGCAVRLSLVGAIQSRYVYTPTHDWLYGILRCLNLPFRYLDYQGVSLSGKSWSSNLVILVLGLNCTRRHNPLSDLCSDPLRISH